MPRPILLDNAIIQFLYASGLYRLLEVGYGGRGSILTFHRVCPETTVTDFRPNRGLEISSEFFEQIVTLLLDRGIEIVDMSEAYRRVVAPQSGSRFAVLTFDDGYRDNLEFALPVCHRLGVPMTVYVTSGFVDRSAAPWWLALEEAVRENAGLSFEWDEEPHCLTMATPEEKTQAYARLGKMFHGMTATAREDLISRLCACAGRDYRASVQATMLTWDEVRKMLQSGLVEIGGHTVTHPQLAALEREDALAEIYDGCASIEAQTGRPVRHIAYPSGRARDAGPREFALCRQLRLETAVTTRHGNLTAAHADKPYAWPRLPVSGLRQSRAAAEVTLSGSIAALANGFRRTVVA